MKREIIEKQIEVVNDLLKILCDELNEYSDIDDYEIALVEEEYTNVIDKRPQRDYRLNVSAIKNISLEEKNEEI